MKVTASWGMGHVFSNTSMYVCICRHRCVMIDFTLKRFQSAFPFQESFFHSSLLTFFCHFLLHYVDFSPALVTYEKGGLGTAAGSVWGGWERGKEMGGVMSSVLGICGNLFRFRWTRKTGSWLGLVDNCL